MKGISLPLALTESDGTTQRTIKVNQLVIAGWTGRDPDLVEKHIRELEELGVPRPPSTPVFYRAAASRLTCADAIETIGDQSGGEVEFVLLRAASRLWVGVGSDHTDRAVETYNVTVSKQMCDKPLASTFWDFDEIAPHWDRLILRSRVKENGEWVAYQDGTVSSMFAPADLLARYGATGGKFDDGTLMFCGTLAAAGGVRPTEAFEFALKDPVLRRKIEHRYSVVSLPKL